MKFSTSKETWLLLFIILAGSVLRFYHFRELPLTFDEFSALSRTVYDNFNDLIRLGVVESDTHPAGVQVFMYYWVMVFGDGSMIIKLPFMLAGLASIYFAFLISRKWFNGTVGIIVAMFMAFLQYPIYLTQMARPYASGLFLSVLLVWFWSNAFVRTNSIRPAYVVGFVVSAALCAYNHYFTLFFAGVVSASGLFVVKRKMMLPYLLSLGAAVLLFVPHLRIFFIQLGKGGIESWLAKPGPGFFIEYIRFILHFNPVMYIVTAILFATGLMVRTPEVKKGNIYRMLILAWIIVTYGVAYFYSVYVNAVLQYSVLLFTFPFLIMLLFSYIRNIRFPFKLSAVVVFGVVSVLTLIYGREHYSIFYNSGQREILKIADEKYHNFGSDSLTILIDMPPNINQYYFDKLSIDPDQFQHIDELGGYKGLVNYLQNHPTEYLLLGWYDQKQIGYFSLIKQYYPFVLEKKSWFLCDYFLLSKHQPIGADYQPAERTIYEFEKSFTKDGGFTKFSETDDYISLFSGQYSEIVKNQTNNLYFSLGVSLPDLSKDVLVVTEFRQGETIVNWRASSFLDFVDVAGESTIMHEGVKLIDLKTDPDNTLVKIYIWNKNKVPFTLYSFHMEILEGNPKIYGLYYPF
ncbi:MAG: glycosyltransferase family 39 protein [Bacteroidales bacterium]|nr:glycosyltransferase family 39 protein [Bacteroidales bacterium]